MSHPLITGFKDPPPIQARLALNALPEGACIESIDELRSWIESGIIEFSFKSGQFIYGTAGTIEGATVGDRETLRLVFDNEGRCMGLAVYSSQAKAWVRTGSPGELLTIYRTEDTVERDMEVKLLKNGWLLCDGSLSGAPDLVGSAPGETEEDPPIYADNDFFRKDEGEWTIYTVIKVA